MNQINLQNSLMNFRDDCAIWYGNRRHTEHNWTARQNLYREMLPYPANAFEQIATWYLLKDAADKVENELRGIAGLEPLPQGTEEA
jgi:hypothetical protein